MDQGQKPKFVADDGGSQWPWDAAGPGCALFPFVGLWGCLLSFALLALGRLAAPLVWLGQDTWERLRRRDRAAAKLPRGPVRGGEHH